MSRDGRGRALFAPTLVGCLLLGVAGVELGVYARAHLRRPPHVNPCFGISGHNLKYLADASGTERHTLANGQVVYLRGFEDDAVRCAYQFFGGAYSARFAEAFAELDPGARAEKLVAIVEHAPPGRSGDDEAQADYLFASGALANLPDAPEVLEARALVEDRHDCRFYTGHPCATRPPLPWTVPAF
ncbi:MAG TPA: hypothetical protein VHB21_26670, partial [Minicystis sp.]|nr:hypothetical protein [Minicystis sp.]